VEERERGWNFERRGLEAPQSPSFRSDDKSIRSERGKAFFKTDGTKLECL